MAYDLYFDSVCFPVTPSKIDTKFGNKNKVIELINEGDVNVVKGAGLTSFSFTLLLPNQRYPFASYKSGYQPAKYYVDLLANYKMNKQPFQFILSRQKPDGTVMGITNMRVTLEDYSVDEDASQHGMDLSVKVNLKQYVEYGTKVASISVATKTVTPKKEEKSEEPRSKSYTVQNGDTLSAIAKKLYGDASKWKQIFSANQSQLDSVAKARGKGSSQNGHWIFTGTTITIP